MKPLRCQYDFDGPNGNYHVISLKQLDSMYYVVLRENDSVGRKPKERKRVIPKYVALLMRDYLGHQIDLAKANLKRAFNMEIG